MPASCLLSRATAGNLDGRSHVTRVLAAVEQGDPGAADRPLPLVYDELRKLAAARMAAERPDHTLNPTALVHEAYVRLAGGGPAPRLEQPRPFFAAPADLRKLFCSVGVCP